jgi:hypothetical protein
MTSAPAVWSGPSFSSGAPSARPPRRPRRRLGSWAAMASHRLSAVRACCRITSAPLQSSGLTAVNSAVKRSRSSGVRDRRPTRCASSAYRWRRRAASAAPSPCPSGESSSGSCGAGGVDRAGRASGRASWRPSGRPLPPVRPAGFCERPVRPARSRSRGSRRGCRAGTGLSRKSPFQSNVRSGWVCSSASRTSGSSGFRPIWTCEGDRNRYSSFVRAWPLPGREACITYVQSYPRLS